MKALFSILLIIRHLNGTHEVEHKYYFIDHYCGRPDELKYETLHILESGTGEDAHFAITPFEFNDYPGLGFEIVCTISLCYEPFFTCKLPGKCSNVFNLDIQSIFSIFVCNAKNSGFSVV